jgi:S-adenosylmethionine:tRNA ribosyltransferase-isomerase
VSRNPEPYPTSAFDYPLPAELIARHPAEQRDRSRLLVLHRATGTMSHRSFHDIVTLLEPGDALVLNDTRVFPARLIGRKTSGARAEVLLLHPLGEDGFASTTWAALVRPGAKLRPGSRIDIAADLAVDVLDVLPDGARVVRIDSPLGLEAAVAKHGRVPLPPYIDRDVTAADVERYQTVYAAVTGSVAAPTAGLHFTPSLLDEIEDAGVSIARLTLHVGPGTFRPVDTEDPSLHHMHEESYAVPAGEAARINSVRAAGGRVWAVGTTVVRTLETVAADDGTVREGVGHTSIFIRPPYRFRAVDHLITNFHLPRSTLLMLAAAFGGYDAVMHAYREAIRLRYRFYSYGDAMVIE